MAITKNRETLGHYEASGESEIMIDDQGRFNPRVSFDVLAPPYLAKHGEEKPGYHLNYY